MLHDANIIENSINLKECGHFLDLGCGTGDYSLLASKIVGINGKVYSIDRNQETISDFIQKISSENIQNIETIIADITKKLPINNQTIDVCLLSTVLHSINNDKDRQIIFGEVYRILKPNGVFIIIECKKENQDFGPPLHMKLSPNDIENIAVPYGFKKFDLIDLGYTYLLKFKS